MRRRLWPRLLSTLLIGGLFALGWWWEQKTVDRSRSQKGDAFLAPGKYAVRHVVDGDTLLLEYNRVKVRLQGIDTPETVKKDHPVEPWGSEASDYTEHFILQAHGRVRLEPSGATADLYGRQLAFVWHDKRLLNEELVRQGLAHAKLDYDYSATLKERLRQAQVEAQDHRRGIWSQGD
ncbi:MAG: thermonuclease family protein [Pirellulales bacterium]|nr:thermonuclease family protein [Pirellulales bacterium]